MSLLKMSRSLSESSLPTASKPSIYTLENPLSESWMTTSSLFALLMSLWFLVWPNFSVTNLVSKCKLKGLLSIKEILNKSSASNELQTSYYCLLNLWLLTFEKTTRPLFADPKLLLIPVMIEATKNLSREKVSRVAFKCFRVNLS